jgi:hypothetical protein
MAALPARRLARQERRAWAPLPEQRLEAEPLPACPRAVVAAAWFPEQLESERPEQFPEQAQSLAVQALPRPAGAA